jgi:hypothetical protein
MHPLAGLPQDPFALALGGQWPEALNFLSSDPDIAMTAYKGLAVPEELKARYVAAVRAQTEQVQSLAFLLEPPAKAEDPLLQSSLYVLRVKDSKAYRAAVEQVAALQLELAKATDTEAFTTLAKDLLPGTPSFSVTTDLTKMPGLQLPAAQARMIFGFLLGGSQLKISSAQVDDHTWLSTFGDTDTLKWALVRARQSASLPAGPMLKREDQLLPSASRFSLYLSLKGARDLAQAVMGTLGQSKPLPVVKDLPPLGVAFTLDASGIEFQGAGQPETLSAIKALVDDGSKRFAPAKPDKEGDGQPEAQP